MHRRARGVVEVAEQDRRRGRADEVHELKRLRGPQVRNTGRVPRLEVRAGDGDRRAVDQQWGLDVAAVQIHAVRDVTEVGGIDRGDDRTVQTHAIGVPQQRVVVGHGHAGKRRRDEVRALPDERVVQPARVQIGHQNPQEVLIHRDAERRDVDVDLTHFLEAHDVGAIPGDFIRQRLGAQGERRLPDGGDGLEQCGEIVCRIGRAQRLDDDVHIRPDVHVAGHHGDATSPGARRGDTGDADAVFHHGGEKVVPDARGDDRKQREQGTADTGSHGPLRGARSERER